MYDKLSIANDGSIRNLYTTFPVDPAEATAILDATTDGVASPDTMEYLDTLHQLQLLAQNAAECPFYSVAKAAYQARISISTVSR
jgi:hypothetical protein